MAAALILRTEVFLATIYFLTLQIISINSNAPTIPKVTPRIMGTMLD